MNKKGVSPIIATVLLIGIVVALSLIVFFWFKSFTQETVTKFGGQNIQLFCDQLSFKASYSSTDSSLAISNTGNIPIYDFNIKVERSGGDYSTYSIKDLLTNWNGLKSSEAFSGSIGSKVSGANDIVLIPILRGTTSSGDERSFTCPDQYGQTISL